MATNTSGSYRKQCLLSVLALSPTPSSSQLLLLAFAQLKQISSSHTIAFSYIHTGIQSSIPVIPQALFLEASKVQYIMNTTTICQSCVKLVDKNATLVCDTTKGSCGKCSLLGIPCKPVPEQLSLKLQDIFYYHSRWRTALETGDKAMAKEAKLELSDRAMDLIDAIDDLENPSDPSTDAAGSVTEASSSKEKESSPVKLLSAVKDKGIPFAKTASKKPTGVVKRTAAARTPKPKALAQLRSKAEKLAVEDPKGAVANNQLHLADKAEGAMTSATNTSNTVNNNAIEETFRHGHSHVLPSHPTAGHTMANIQRSAYSNNLHYQSSAAIDAHPAVFMDQDNSFLDDGNMFNSALLPDDLSIFNDAHFLDHNSLNSSPISDPSFQTVERHALPSSTPFTMPSSSDRVGSGQSGGFHVSHDVGVRILEQLQTLNTTLSGMYEMMRQQQHQHQHQRV